MIPIFPASVQPNDPGTRVKRAESNVYRLPFACQRRTLNIVRNGKIEANERMTTVR